MALNFNSLGFLIEETPAQGDTTTANSYTADTRALITNPDNGMICFDPETRGLLFWNGIAWVPVVSQTTTRTVATVTANYVMPGTVDVVVVNATASPITVTLPSVTSTSGREIAVVKSDDSNNVVTLQCVGGDFIGDGADTTFTLLAKNSTVQLMSTDTGIWYVI